MNAEDPLSAVPNYSVWLTPDQVATRLGVSSIVVNSWIVTGIRTETGRLRLRAVKIGGRWKIEPVAITEFVTASTTASLPAAATNPAAEIAPKPDSEADIRRRGEACMARLKAAGLRLDGPPGRRKRNNGD